MPVEPGLTEHAHLEPSRGHAESGTSEPRPDRGEAPIYDFSKLHASVANYRVCEPSDAIGVQLAILAAADAGLAVRVRGGGHSMSGLCLPREGELLLRTEGIDHYRFETPDTITVGAGALVWNIRDFVRTQGYEMPIFHGGWAGVTLGGYINAGGLGDGRSSQIHGGLWENIEEISFLDGTGRLNTIHRCNPMFPWLFGAFGQFGVIVEVKLNLIHSYEAEHPRYPLGEAGRIPQLSAYDPGETARAPQPEHRLQWFTMLAAPEREAEAWALLEGLRTRHASWLVPTGGWAGPTFEGAPIGYHYLVSFENFNPPLFYARQETFLVMGMMTICATGDDEADAQRQTAAKEFAELCQAQGFGLYVQAENMARSVDLRRYYGEQIYARVLEYKAIFDPEGRMNPGIFE